MKTSDKLKAVLCNPDGEAIMFHGDYDPLLIEDAIAEVEGMEKERVTVTDWLMFAVLFGTIGYALYSAGC